MKISKVLKKDFESIFNLLNELWPHEKLDEKKTKGIFERKLKRKNNVQLVALEKGVIGYASISIKESFQEQGKVAFLDELIITEKFRGKGVEKELLEEISKKAKDKGCKKIQLYSSFKREREHEFYVKNGFNKKAFFFWKTL